MPHIERDLEYFQFPCLLFLFQVQNLLLSSPYLFLDLLNFQPVLSQFVLFVTLLFFFFNSSCPVLCRCIRQSKPYFFLCFSSISRTDGSCSWHTYVPGKFFLLILSYLATKDVPLGKFTFSGMAYFSSTIFCLIFTFFFFYHQNFFLI